MNWTGMIVGAVIGFGFYFLVRCPGNACPVTSTWWIPTILGAILGLSWPKAHDKKGDSGKADAE